MRADVFLYCTLGGFDSREADSVEPRLHCNKLRRMLDDIATRDARYGEVVAIAERFGRSVNSLRAAISQRRRKQNGCRPYTRRVVTSDQVVRGVRHAQQPQCGDPQQGASVSQ